MIFYKSAEEIELIRQSSLLVAKTLAQVARHIRQGVTTRELDAIAEEFIRDHGGKPGFKGYNGFPATLCISPNEVVVHGIPDNRVLVDGDIVSVDCGVIMNGFYGDSAYTFCVGEVKEEIRELLKVTRESLEAGIKQAVVGQRLGDISSAVQQVAEQAGYSVVRDLVGHGLGRHLHESPEVPNFGKRGTGLKLQEGLVIAVEPMINMGKKGIVQERDGWTIRTIDRLPSAHFEHTIAIKAHQADVLSSFDFIEEVLKNK